MIAQEVNPVYKAVRDLEPGDQEMVLRVIELLAGIKGTSQIIEIKPWAQQGQHRGWNVYHVHRRVQYQT